jgi:integrase
MVFLMARPTRRQGSRFPYARKVVPKDVKGVIGLSEFKRPLHGATASENRRLNAEALAEWEGRIAAARAELRGQRRSLSLREADALCGAWYRQEAARLADDPGTASHWEEERDYLADMFQQTSEDSHEREFVADQFIRGEADALLKCHGIVADPRSVGLVAERLAMARLKLAETMTRRLNGDWSNDANLNAFPEWHPAQAEGGQQTSTSAGPTFAKLLDAWAAERQPSPRTRDLYAIAFRHIERCLGFDDARRVTTEHVRDYKAARLAAGRNVGTVEDEVRAAGAVFNWAVRNKLVSSNPFAGMAPRPLRRIGGEGRGYTDDEAAQLLNAARRETGWRRWLPWALCFTGARISDLADLRRRDVRQEAGVWIFDIVPTSARRGKTATFQRMLPVHPALIAEGFIQYVSGLPDGGPLWPDIVANAAGSRQDNATTNLGRWVRGRGGLTGSKKQPTHGFRHRMEDELRRARVLPEVFDAITGRHNPRNAGAGYGLGFRRMPDETLKELRRVPVPPGVNPGLSSPAWPG